MNSFQLKVILAASLVIPVLAYGWYMDDLSESQMARIAYVWLPALVFSATALIAGRGAQKYALIAGAITFLALPAFFELIFPKL